MPAASAVRRNKRELKNFPGLNVDREREKIALGLKQKTPSPWANVADKYPVGSRHTGEVVNVMSYGAFVELEPGLEGLSHISELADHKVESPEDVVKVGDEIEVKVLRVDAADRKIGLSRKRLTWEKDDEEGEEGEGSEGSGGPAPPRPQRELRGGTGSSSGQLFTMPESGDDRS